MNVNCVLLISFLHFHQRHFPCHRKDAFTSLSCPFIGARLPKLRWRSRSWSMKKIIAAYPSTSNSLSSLLKTPPMNSIDRPHFTRSCGRPRHGRCRPTVPFVSTRISNTSKYGSKLTPTSSSSPRTASADWKRSLVRR